MGRRAGVTAEETRGQLLQAAARVFARRGYEGASIAEISSEASLTSGAMYAHYGSKAELFVATLRAYKWQEIRRLIGSGGTDFLDLLAMIGTDLDQGQATDGSLLMEAVVTARRDPEVAALLAATFAERETLVADAVRRAQEVGRLDTSVAPEAVARFTMMLALGALVTAAVDLPPIDHDGWSALIESVVELGRPQDPTSP